MITRYLPLIALLSIASHAMAGQGLSGGYVIVEYPVPETQAMLIPCEEGLDHLDCLDSHGHCQRDGETIARAPEEVERTRLKGVRYHDMPRTRVVPGIYIDKSKPLKIAKCSIVATNGVGLLSDPSEEVSPN